MNLSLYITPNILSVDLKGIEGLYPGSLPKCDPVYVEEGISNGHTNKIQPKYRYIYREPLYGVPQIAIWPSP